MSENKFITIERQYGSGGLEVGKILAKKLDMPCYSHEIIEIAAERSGIPKEYLEVTQEDVSRSFVYKLSLAAKSGTVDTEHIRSKSDMLYTEIVKVVNEIAEKESCIIVGQCADYILREHNPFKVFVYAETNDKIKRAVEKYGVSEHHADYILRKNDKRRESFYNANTSCFWGMKDNYHICLNSSLFSLESCADLIIESMKYIKKQD